MIYVLFAEKRLHNPYRLSRRYLVVHQETRHRLIDPYTYWSSEWCYPHISMLVLSLYEKQKTGPAGPVLLYAVIVDCYYFLVWTTMLPPAIA